MSSEPKQAKDEDDILELAKALALAAAVALCIRSLLFEPFSIPSGSMLPTLQVGDYLFVEKYAYGYSRYSFPFDLATFSGRIMERAPERGDIAVFRQPRHPQIDYIKRIIGLPGDRIQVRGGILFVNGTPASRDYQGREEYRDDMIFNMYSRFIETLPGGRRHAVYEISDSERFDNTPVYTVPEGYYFAMGDNRDSSLDSRAEAEVGPIPADNLVGRAAFLFFSTHGVGNKCDREGTFAPLKSLGCKLVEWPKAIRFKRILRPVHGLGLTP